MRFLLFLTTFYIIYQSFGQINTSYTELNMGPYPPPVTYGSLNSLIYTLNVKDHIDRQAPTIIYNQWVSHLPTLLLEKYYKLHTYCYDDRSAISDDVLRDHHSIISVIIYPMTAGLCQKKKEKGIFIQKSLFKKENENDHSCVTR